MSKFETFNSPELNCIKDVFNQLHHLQLDVNIAYIVESYIYSIVKKSMFLHSHNTEVNGEYRVRFDKRDGEYKKWWSENGNKHIECFYHQDKLEGRYVEYYYTGEKYKECSYSKGFLNGKYTVWHSNNNKQCECNYKYGRRYGIRTSWYENGNKCTEYFDNNYKIHNDYKKWDENGILIKHLIYENDNLIKTIIDTTDDNQ